MAPHVKGYGVRATGIPELQRALKATDVGLRKELRTAFKDVARTVIRRAEQRGAPSRILKPTVSVGGAGISFPAGGRSSFTDPVGYYPWLDFGGGAAGGRGVTQRETVRVGGHRFRTGRTRREFIKEGRYLYPAIWHSTQDIVDGAAAAVEMVAERQSLEVKG